MARRVIITHWIGPEIIDFMAHLFDVVPNMSTGSLSSEEILRRMDSAEALMVSEHDRIDGRFLDRCPGLLIVAGASEASGNVDVRACTERGIWVTAAPDASKVRAAGPDEAIRVAALEKAADIIEALLGQRPEGAINTPDNPRCFTRDPARASQFDKN